MKAKIGIIGVGHLGKLHLKLAKELPKIEVAGIFDLNFEHAEKLASEFNVKFFKDIPALLNESDAVIIATPTSTHYEIGNLCLENGKHIFIEKPITSSVDEARTLNSLAEKKSLMIQVGHVERFNPALLSLEKYGLSPMFIQSDRLSQFNPRGTDVAVVLDLMIHDIDIILHLVNSEVADVDASGVAVVSDTYDIANARIKKKTDV